MSTDGINFSETPFRDGAVGADEPNRLNLRAQILLAQNQDLIRGKRVLDIASADGRFSYAAYKLGAAKVTGVEGRPEEVEKGRKWLRQLGADADRWELIASDIFDYLPKCEPGEFDTVLCFGFFYHTLRQVEMMREFVRLAPKAVIMDTTVAAERRWLRPARFLWRLLKNPNPLRWKSLWHSVEGDEVMHFKTEWSDKAAGSIINNFYARAEWERGHPISGNFKPTESMCERLFEVHDFEWNQIDWFDRGIKDWSGLDDYEKRLRVSYILRPR